MDWNYGTDLVVVPTLRGARRRVARPVARPCVSARAGASRRAGRVRSARRGTAGENLAQALLLRLLTPRGSLAALGHAAYGSRLGELDRPAQDGGAAEPLSRVRVGSGRAGAARRDRRRSSSTSTSLRRQQHNFVFTLAVSPHADHRGGDPVAISLEVGL